MVRAIKIIFDYTEITKDENILVKKLSCNMRFLIIVDGRSDSINTTLLLKQHIFQYSSLLCRILQVLAYTEYVE